MPNPVEEGSSTNIRVYCRFRPLTSTEGTASCLSDISAAAPQQQPQQSGGDQVVLQYGGSGALRASGVPQKVNFNGSGSPGLWRRSSSSPLPAGGVSGGVGGSGEILHSGSMGPDDGVSGSDSPLSADSPSAPSPKQHSFMFDKAFGGEASQEDVYQAVAAPLVESLWRGFHSTVFAYGQTGSGKTFSVFGSAPTTLSPPSVAPSSSRFLPRAPGCVTPDTWIGTVTPESSPEGGSPPEGGSRGGSPTPPDGLEEATRGEEGVAGELQPGGQETGTRGVGDPEGEQGDGPAVAAGGAGAGGRGGWKRERGTREGLTGRVVEDIFRHVEAGDGDASLLVGQVKVSFLEIYNEKIKDLLRPSTADMQLRESPKVGMFVEGLREETFSTASSLMQRVREASRYRAVGSHAMNSRSSRSHAVLIISTDQLDMRTGEELAGRMHIVDLAGSESLAKTGAVGVRQQEAKQINKSLSSLGNVIMALTKSTPHVPYRDSKLTRILKNALGGDNQTSLLLTCSPSLRHASETLSTLRFGQRAKGVKNTPVVHRERSLAEYSRMLDASEKREAELQEQVRMLQQRLAMEEALEEEEEEEEEEEGIGGRGSGYDNSSRRRGSSSLEEEAEAGQDGRRSSSPRGSRFVSEEDSEGEGQQREPQERKAETEHDAALGGQEDGEEQGEGSRGDEGGEGDDDSGSREAELAAREVAHHRIVQDLSEELGEMMERQKILCLELAKTKEDLAESNKLLGQEQGRRHSLEAATPPRPPRPVLSMSMFRKSPSKPSQEKRGEDDESMSRARRAEEQEQDTFISVLSDTKKKNFLQRQQILRLKEQEARWRNLYNKSDERAKTMEELLMIHIRRKDGSRSPLARSPRARSPRSRGAMSSLTSVQARAALLTGVGGDAPLSKEQREQLGGRMQQQRPEEEEWPLSTDPEGLKEEEEEEQQQQPRSTEEERGPSEDQGLEEEKQLLKEEEWPLGKDQAELREEQQQLAPTG